MSNGNVVKEMVHLLSYDEKKTFVITRVHQLDGDVWQLELHRDKESTPKDLIDMAECLGLYDEFFITKAEKRPGGSWELFVHMEVENDNNK